MTPNMGNTDRVIRIVVGLSLLSQIYFLDGNARWRGLIGPGFLATAFVRYCSSYKRLGIDTLGKKKEPAAP